MVFSKNSQAKKSLSSLSCVSVTLCVTYLKRCLFFDAEKCERDDGCEWNQSSCGSSYTGPSSHFKSCSATAGNVTRALVANDDPKMK